jgi:LysM repeat protein
LKIAHTTLIFWILTTMLIFPMACGRTPAPREHPASAATLDSPADPGATEAEPPAEEAAQPSPAAAPEPFVHRVNAGETLGGIARWYTGKEANWRRLAQVNPDIQPQRMQIGALIRIPEDLLIRRAPMPRTVQPIPASKEAPPATSADDAQSQTPPPADDVELFGPIESLSQPDRSGAPLELETLE